MMLFRPATRLNSLSLDSGDEIDFTDPRIVDFLHANDYTSADEALKNSDLYALVARVSADVATSQFMANMPRAQTLLDNPTPTANKHAFWQSVAAQLLLDGNAYAYMWRNVNGIVARLEYLRPSQVSAFLLDDGSGLTYNITFDEPSIGILNNVPQGDVLHFRLLSTNGGKTGRSPLLSLQNELNIKHNSNKLTLEALGKAIMPNGILHIKGMGLLDNKRKIALSKGFEKQANGSSGPVVLDDLSTYDPLEIKSDVSSLLSSTDWTSRQIAKVYGIPDSYLNGQGDQQSSIVMIGEYYANALHQYTAAVESELTQKLNVTVSIDLMPAIDQDLSSYAATVGDAASKKVITTEQANFMLRKKGFIPSDAPDYDQGQLASTTLKGGDNKDDSN
ncbi:phage portal protein [Lapidilactobacillus wuchangensis]|uniref:phage portal protein n=1 Tax=Lapidilactobacillus wuchangensis TaxID=2486001 RepID=UPI000F7A2B97|nr:phage portal protein [Lapidilactobacillus wuchangensis]